MIGPELLSDMEAMADELWRMSDRMSDAHRPWAMTVVRMRQCASSMRWQVNWERRHLAQSQEG